MCETDICSSSQRRCCENLRLFDKTRSLVENKWQSSPGKSLVKTVYSVWKLVVLNFLLISNIAGSAAARTTAIPSGNWGVGT